MSIKSSVSKKMGVAYSLDIESLDDGELDTMQ